MHWWEGMGLMGCWGLSAMTAKAGNSNGRSHVAAVGSLMARIC